MGVRKSNPTEDVAAREIVITRTFNAPRTRVWESWTDPTQVLKWWGPKGFTTTIKKMDVRPGGVWKHVMHGPDGTDYPNSSVFKEVVKPERIVYSHGGGKEDGPGVHFEATWTFEAEGDQTRVTIRMVFDTAADRDRVVKEFNAIEGGNQTLERLEEHMATDLSGTSADANAPGVFTDADFVISRVFNAPRELVFKVFTDPTHLMHWWGPKGFTVVSTKMELRPGGVFHYCLKSPEGNLIWGKFAYREINEPARLVFINSFADDVGNTARHPMSPTWPLQWLATITFDSQAGDTLLTVRWTLLPETTAVERATFNAGRASMQMGWTGTLDQLTAYLSSVARDAE